MRQFISGLFLWCSFFFFYSEGEAGNIRYAALSDSLRLRIRLTSRLLVPASDCGAYQKLADSEIPLAFDCRGTEKNYLKGLEKFSAEGRPVFVVSDSDSLLTTSFSIIQICPGDFGFYRYKSPAFPDSTTSPAFTCRELLLVEMADSLVSSNDLLNLWQLRGKKPNFILAPETKLDKCLKIIDFLNRQEKIFGVVSSDDGLLPGVILKDLPGCQVNGYFSFPLSGKLLLKPYKAGYQFSPDVINYAPSNKKNMKIFRAVRLDPGFGLSDHFTFNKRVRNSCRPGDNEFIIQNVGFVNDKIHGPVAFFNHAYIDAGLESRKILNSAFSILVWIKPVELGENNSILGKGTNFVIKLHNGKLTFTMAGVKDYISGNSPVPAGKWTHVAVVFSEIEKKLKFYMNGKMTDQISLIADYQGSDFSLLIGSNLWEEFFNGYIGDIKIWERELNDQEVLADFRSSPDKSERGIIGWIAGAALLIVLLFVLFRKKKSREKQKAKISDNREPTPCISDKMEEIRCFGNLRILCKDSTDLITRLSPKLRQLFVLILLYSGPGKKGIGSKKMSELLWPGMNAANAKNARGTSIQNLRQGLGTCSDITIAFKDKMWILEIGDNVFCDYFEAEKLLSRIEKNNSNQQKILIVTELISVLKTGKFLQSVDALWLDTFKDQFSARLVEICLGLLASSDKKQEALQLELAGIISIYDELNETALKTKVHILNAQGKHSLAKSVYESYVKLYTELYDSNYPVDFPELVKG